jgi:HK97 gp10 family phage protein
VAELELQGMQELMAALQSISGKSKSIQNKALKKAAKPILDDATRTTTFKDVSGAGRTGLKISRPKSKGDVTTVLIGVDKADISEIFYMKMVEFGTTKMVARPFLTNAYLNNKTEAIRILREELRKGLGL